MPPKAKAPPLAESWDTAVMAPAEVSLHRYQRQILIEDFGWYGQERLKNAKVVIAGAGGLGSPIAIYLAVAGIGKIRLIDGGRVELSNLNRQILYWDKDIGEEKANAAKEKIQSLNSEVTVETVSEIITERNVFNLVADCSAIVDALDNFPGRYLLNKAAIRENIPLFHGAVYGFAGRATTIIPGETPCLRCIYRRIPPSEECPVIGVAPAVIGSIQATEVLKYVAGIGKLLTNRLLLYDGLALRFMEIELKRHPECEECRPFVAGER
jgi:adenylyltransferase/sulfurtransferase